MQREEALEALVAAQDVNSRVRRHGRWYAGYAAVYGVLTFVFTLGVGLFPTPITVGVVTPLWVVAVCGLSVYAYRQPVSPLRFGRLHLAMIGCWSVLYTGTVVVGAAFFPGEAWWWGTGAALCAIPPFIAAAYAHAIAAEPQA
ncbi:hypothetical protein CLV63_11185 [Murinocardiopsis flavida]|uniref:Uncharacterized protein n=1 Tax=Murinocardiopsis flavida TaxID=645275 RepID=A0A2P8DGY0_9ACTN|nr:hypothetical protein [Murinocardiopsis flavida]PSK96490.1 hypothetical protein CLV63_11185 [Murinocardiopsis flavida]